MNLYEKSYKMDQFAYDTTILYEKSYKQLVSARRRRSDLLDIGGTVNDDPFFTASQHQRLR